MVTQLFAQDINARDICVQNDFFSCYQSAFGFECDDGGRWVSLHQESGGSRKSLMFLRLILDECNQNLSTIRHYFLRKRLNPKISI